MTEYTGTCKQCGNEFTSSRSHAEFCSGKCRAAYSREAKKSKTHETHGSAQPSTEAVFVIPEGYELVATQDLERYRAALDMMLNEKLGALTDPQKKSDFAPSQTTFTPPTEKLVVKEIPDDERIRRTAANTAAALDDF